MGLACGSDGKASAYNAGDLSSIPGSGRSSGDRNGNPLQCSWPGRSHGWRSLVGYSPWGHKESDTIELLTFIQNGYWSNLCLQESYGSRSVLKVKLL